MLRWLERTLPRRWAAATIIALAVLLEAPSVATGFVADDHLHQILLRGDHPFAGLPTSRLDLFTFASGDPARTRALVDVGMFPWATDLSVRLAFFRPISSATHLLDEAIAPGSPVFAHVHSLVWFAFALVAVWAFYRRFLGTPWVAGLALLLYAVDDTHGPAVGWIANRNALAALALALPAVVFHDRWRKDGWAPGAWLAPLFVAMGLLAGESAIAVCAYLFAYALHLDRGRPLQRALTLAPYALTVGAWLVVYKVLGYGASGSGVYLDPAHDPAGFARALPTRLAALLASQLAAPWSDFAELYAYASARLAEVMTVVSFVVVLALAALFTPLWRTSTTARFFTTGLLLATLPICATFPADRLLTFVGVGAMGIVALFLAEPRRGFVSRVAAFALVTIHLVLAPPLQVLRARSMVTVERTLAKANDSLPKTPDLANETMILVNPASDVLAGYLVITRTSRREPRPERLRWLAAGTSALAIERLDDRTLRLRPARGFLENVAEQMLRSPRRPFAVGDRVELTGFSAEVTRLLPDGRPAEVVFRFAVPLEDPSLVWFQWSDRGYVPFTPPPVGSAITLPATDFLRAMFPPPPPEG